MQLNKLRKFRSLTQTSVHIFILKASLSIVLVKCLASIERVTERGPSHGPAVSCRPFTAEARVWSQAISFGNLWCTKWLLSFPRTSVYPCHYHSCMLHCHTSPTQYNRSAHNAAGESHTARIKSPVEMNTHVVCMHTKLIVNCVLPTVVRRMAHPMAQLIQALRYKPEGRRFDSRWCHWNISLT